MVFKKWSGQCWLLTSTDSKTGFRLRFDSALTDLTYRVGALTDRVDWTEAMFASRINNPPSLIDGWRLINGALNLRKSPRRFLRL